MINVTLTPIIDPNYYTINISSEPFQDLAPRLGGFVVNSGLQALKFPPSIAGRAAIYVETIGTLGETAGDTTFNE